MKKIKLGQTGIEVSQIGFVVLPIGPHQRNLTPQEGGEILSYALKKGINFIDTAQYYETYPHIAKALKDCENRPVICSKCLGGSYEEMKYAVQQTIDSLGLNYVDIFLLHELRTGDFALRQGAWEYLKEAKAKGLVKAIGVSTHHIDVVEEMTLVPECDVIFPLINYMGLGIRKGSLAGSLEEMENAIKVASLAGKGIFTMKAFGGGPLVKNYVKCLDYNLSVEGSASTMIGFASKSDVDDLFRYLDGDLPKDYIPNIKEKKMRVEKGSCEGCGACIKKCASGAIGFSREDGLAEIDHTKCMTCGYCLPACPVRAIILY